MKDKVIEIQPCVIITKLYFNVIFCFLRKLCLQIYIARNPFDHMNITTSTGICEDKPSVRYIDEILYVILSLESKCRVTRKLYVSQYNTYFYNGAVRVI